MSVAERAEIETLARNLPAVWHSPHNGVVEKRRSVRILLERVVVWAPASSQEVTVHLHWSLGTVTEHKLMRPVNSWERVAGAAMTRERVQEWQTAGWTSGRIAAELNAGGFRTPRGKSFTAESVRKLLERGRSREEQIGQGKEATAKRAGSDVAERKCQNRATVPGTAR